MEATVFAQAIKRKNGSVAKALGGVQSKLVSLLTSNPEAKQQVLFLSEVAWILCDGKAQAQTYEKFLNQTDNESAKRNGRSLSSVISIRN